MTWRNKYRFKTGRRIVKASDPAPEGTDGRLRRGLDRIPGSRAVWRMLPAGDAGTGTKEARDE